MFSRKKTIVNIYHISYGERNRNSRGEAQQGYLKCEGSGLHLRHSRPGSPSHEIQSSQISIAHIGPEFHYDDELYKLRHLLPSHKLLSWHPQD